jgi:hypothetical protein
VAPVPPPAAEDPVHEDPLVPNWLKIATDNGFANLDEVKAF